MLSIAYFISSHGFGHATRAAAVMSAIQELAPNTHFEIFTLSPEWLFHESLPGSFSYHALDNDVGLVQKSPLEEDLEATLQRLAGFLPFDDGLTASLAERVQRLDCRLVVCDIAPLGIAVASRASLPSVLVENFTWDWIYEGYLEADERFALYIPYLQEVFQMASYHIQAQPVSRRCPSADLVTPPISRPARQPRHETRLRLGLPLSARVVLVTMGGVPGLRSFAGHPSFPPDVYFIIPGADGQVEPMPNCILLPFHSDFYHPDLVAASDVVVGKAGYSTLAEAYAAGVPFLFIARPRFRETASLTTFIQQEVGGFQITEDEFSNGGWLSALQRCLEQPRSLIPRENGAGQAARFILEIARSAL